MKFSRRADGFTLIEVLIVVSILAILMSLIIVGVQKARVKALESVALNYVTNLTSALEQFREDEGYYPGASNKDAEENAFPELFEALLGDPKESEFAGRSAPYLDIKLKDVAVYDEDAEEYRNAEEDERWDPKVRKFIFDPWGKVYQYRENKSKGREWPGKNRTKTDVWSLGPDKQNSTVEDEEKSDDIGNW
jgi:prepilin-type N-terminal cleavage/methylation domain-containing protein